MKKIISSLLISLSIASCAYNPNVTTLDNVKGNSAVKKEDPNTKENIYVFDVGQSKAGVTISTNVNLVLPSKFKTKASPGNIDGTPAKTLFDMLTVEVYLFALPDTGSYLGTDPITDSAPIPNFTTPLSFTFIPTSNSFGLKLTNVGSSPVNTKYYIGVVAKDAGGNVISQDSPIAWSGSSLNKGICLSEGNYDNTTIDSSLVVHSGWSYLLPITLKLKDATGATVSSNITLNDGISYSYASDMLGLSNIAGGGTITPALSNGMAASNVLLQTASDITVDNLGNVYILDTANSTVFYVNKAGIVNVISTGLTGSIAVSVNALGDVFVLSTGMVSKFTKQSLGVYTRKDFSDINFNTVADISLSSTDPNIVYVATASGATSSVYKLDTSTPTGTVSTYFTPLLTDPYSMTIDGNDNLYFVYQTPANNKQVDTLKNGVLSTLYTSVDPTAIFTDVNVDHTGNIYVSNNSNTLGKGSIIKLSSAGILTSTLAGGGSATTNMNGLPGTYASLNPTLIAIEPGKNLSGDPAVYFVDDAGYTQANLIVRKLVP